MKTYKCLMDSTAGRRDTLIERHPQDEATISLLERGIIAEIKIEQPAETKTARKRKA